MPKLASCLSLHFILSASKSYTTSHTSTTEPHPRKSSLQTGKKWKNTKILPKSQSKTFNKNLFLLMHTQSWFTNFSTTQFMDLFSCSVPLPTHLWVFSIKVFDLLKKEIILSKFSRSITWFCGLWQPVFFTLWAKYWVKWQK